jgi:hypothetical protein
MTVAGNTRRSCWVKPPDLEAYKDLAGADLESADALVCTDTPICAADAHKAGARYRIPSDQLSLDAG